MILFRPIKTIVPLAAALFLAGCATYVPSGTIVEKTVVPYNLAPLDEIDLVRPDGTREALQVDQAGVVDLQGKPVVVKGMAKEKVEKLIVNRYGSNVKVEIIEFRPDRVTVLGEVFHQIHTELTDGPMRVMDAIAAANGFTPIANKRRVRLLRQNAGEITVYELDLREMMLGKDLSGNMLLKPGDIITVPRNFL